jgi:hypothetical protein
MTNIADFRDASGQINWEALHRAEIEAGESCSQCRGMIFPPKGHSSLCNLCRLIREEEGAVDHSNRLRCPKCRHDWAVETEDTGELYGEGSHDVCCPVCGHEFGVVTTVSYSWESPGMVEREGEVNAEGQRGREPVG